VAQAQETRAENARSEEVRPRAYEIHMERGGAHGLDVDDGLQAERELQPKHRTP
jgi:hypothetical protein